METIIFLKQLINSLEKKINELEEELEPDKINNLKRESLDIIQEIEKTLNAI